VEAQLRIGSALKLVGKHNYNVKMADLYCGEGVMVQLLRDSHYNNIVGIEPDSSYEQYWDTEGIIIADPLTPPFHDEYFDLVTCFDASRCEDKKALLREMARLSARYILYRPGPDPDTSQHDETMRMILSERLTMVRYNAPNGWYTIEVN
jgi:hypothetical protein